MITVQNDLFGLTELDSLLWQHLKCQYDIGYGIKMSAGLTP